MKFFSINKSQAAVLTTLLVLISLGSGYFFIYLPHNEGRIQGQHFSALQNIDRNIHTKIENSIGLLNNLLSGYQNADEEGKRRLIKYIREYPSANFKLTYPETIASFKKRSLQDSTGTDSVYSITVNNDTREISLYFSKQEVSEKNDTTAYKMGMNFSFKQFITFLLPKDVFDEYIIFSKGRPVYESFPAGISFVKEDSLLGVKNGVGSAGVRNQVQRPPSDIACSGCSILPDAISIWVPAVVAILAASILVYMPPRDSSDSAAPAIASISDVTDSTIGISLAFGLAPGGAS